MAISIDNTTSYSSGSPSASNATFSHTVGSGNNKLLVVIVPESRLVSITSVTYNGVALTLGKQATNGNSSARVYYLINPPTGTYNVVVTYSVSLTYRVVYAISAFGVHQTTPLGATNSITGTSDTKNISLTTTQNNSLVIESVGALGGQHTANSGQTDLVPLSNRVGAYIFRGTAGVYSASWTATTSAMYSYVILEFIEGPVVITNKGRFFNFF